MMAIMWGGERGGGKRSRLRAQPLATGNDPMPAEVESTETVADDAAATAAEQQRLALAAVTATVAADARATLHGILRMDPRVWIVQRSRSRTGDKRLIAFFVVTDDRAIASITREVAAALGKLDVFDQERQGLWLWRNEDPVMLVFGPLSRAVLPHPEVLEVDWI